MKRDDPEVLLEKRRFGDVMPDSHWRFHEVPQVVFSRRFVALLLICGMAVIAAWLAMNQPPRLALALFLGMVGGVAVLFEPFFGVLAYTMLAYFRPQDVFWGFAGARLTMLVSAFTLVATAIHFAIKPDLRFLWRPQNLFVGIFWLFLWLSTMYGDFGTREDKWMSYWNKLFLIYFISLAVVNSERKLYVLAWVLMLSIGYLAWWANERYFFDGWAVVHGPGRFGATYYDENDFALVIVVAVPFMWYIMRLTKHRLVQLGLLGLVPLAAHAVMVTYSRGGFLGLSAAMLVVALREKNRRLGAALIGLGVVFFLVLAGQEYKDRIGSIDNYEEDASASSRLESWEVGGRMIVRNPVFGVGLKQFLEAFPYYGNYKPHEAHNSWVQVGAECGVFALGSYGMLVLLTLLAIARVQRRIPLLPEGRNRDLADTLSRIYEASLVGYLVCGFFLSMEDFEFFYLLVAMAQILDRITEKRLEDSRRELLAARAAEDSDGKAPEREPELEPA